MAFSFSPKIVTDGLVLALDAANPRSYVSGSTVWRNLTPNSNTGSLINGPTFSSVNAGSIIFDGVDDYVDLQTTIPQIVSSSVVTYNAWVKWNGPAENGTVMGNEPLNQSTGFGIRRRADNTYWLSPGAGISSILTYSVPLSVYSDWHSVTGVLTGTLAILYINGKFATQANWSTQITSTVNFRIGTVLPFPASPDYFTGQISVAQVYNRALSPTEVLQNYNATKSRFNLT